MEDVEFVILSYGVSIGETAICFWTAAPKWSGEFLGNSFVLNALNLSFEELSRCVADDNSPSLVDQTLSSF